jgi:hypothetical protein
MQTGARIHPGCGDRDDTPATYMNTFCASWFVGIVIRVRIGAAAMGVGHECRGFFVYSQDSRHGRLIILWTRSQRTVDSCEHTCSKSR